MAVLQGNMLTGLVNMSIDTLSVSDTTAFVILVGYLAVVSGTIVRIYLYRSSGKVRNS